MNIEYVEVEVIRRAKSFTLTPENIRAIRATVDSGEWREDERARAWVGKAIGKVLKLDPKVDRAAVKQVLKILLATQYLRAVQGTDQYRNSVLFVEVA